MKLRIVALLLAIGMILAACAPKAGTGGGGQATPSPTSTPAGGGMDY
jgi:predicted small secreted protein